MSESFSAVGVGDTVCCAVGESSTSLVPGLLEMREMLRLKQEQLDRFTNSIANIFFKMCPSL